MDLLKIALEISWARHDEISDIVLCYGGMHFLMSVIAGIGYLFADAGLKNLPN